MDWLSQNWIWVVVFVAFIGMHLFGHGGHGGRGGHGGCCGGGNQRPAGEEPPNEEQPNENRPQGHQH